MNFGEQFVASAFQSLGYFVIQGLKVGVREADLLAIKIVNSKFKYYHIEVQISRNPVGVLRAQSRFGKTSNNPMKAAEEYIDKKFFQKDVVKTIKNCFGTSKYERIFIHGLLREPEQLKVFNDRDIKCLDFKSLAQEANKSSHKTDAFLNFYDISKLVHLK